MKNIVKIGFTFNDVMYCKHEMIDLILKDSKSLKALGIKNKYNRVEIVDYNDYSLSFKHGTITDTILWIDIVAMSRHMKVDN